MKVDKFDFGDELPPSSPLCDTKGVAAFPSTARELSPRRRSARWADCRVAIGNIFQLREFIGRLAGNIWKFLRCSLRTDDHRTEPFEERWREKERAGGRVGKAVEDLPSIYDIFHTLINSAMVEILRGATGYRILEINLVRRDTVILDWPKRFLYFFSLCICIRPPR